MANRDDDVVPAASVRGRVAHALLTFHLLLAPLFFLSDTTDAFEYPKVALLGLVAILLAAIGASTWIDAAFLGTWRRDALGHLRRVFCDPLGVAVLLFVLSSFTSTLTSVSPRTSWRGYHGSEFGLRTVLAYA